MGHHLKYDSHVLANHGIRLAGMRYDSMLESYVLDSTATRHDMDSVARKYLGLDTIHFEDVAGKGAKQICFDQVSVEKAAEYAAEDADITLRLHHVLWPRLEATAGLAALYDSIRAAAGARARPHGADRRAGGHTPAPGDVGEFAGKMAELEKEAHQAAGHPFNIGSPRQLQEVLFNELKLPVTQYTPTKQPSTNEDALAELATQHPLPQLILDYRSLSKLKSTYTTNYRTDLRAHRTGAHLLPPGGGGDRADCRRRIRTCRTSRSALTRAARSGGIRPTSRTARCWRRYFIQLRIMAHLVGDRPGRGLREDRTAPGTLRSFGVPLEEVTADQRRSARPSTRPHLRHERLRPRRS